MKLKKILGLLLIVAVAFAITACGGTKSFTVMFDFNGGSNVVAQIVEEGNKATEPTAPTYAGYTFKGWYNGETAWDFDTVITADVTLTAKWEAIPKYTVTFDSNGGSDVAAQTVEEGKKATEPTAPTKDNYTFAGWFNGETAWDFNTAVTANVTLTAKWNINTYEVTFNADGGSDVAAQTIDHGGKVTKPADPTKDGYTFAGWYVGETGWDFDNDTVTAAVTLTAKWEIVLNDYTVSFNTAGGSAVASQTVTEGNKATKPADPTKTGYTFTGWFNGEEAWDFETAVTANVSLTAKWTINTYTVTFNADNGTENTTASVDYNNPVAAPAAPEKTGFAFAGWFNGDAAWDFNTAVTADVTLTAKWTAIFTVEFDADNGSEKETAQVLDGNKATKPADPTKTGYTFVGWFNNETAWDFETAVTANLSLIAKWEPLTLTVVVDADNGTDPTTLTVSYDSLLTLDTPVKEGYYVFLGWFVKGEDGTLSETAWNLATDVVTSDMTLVAVWEFNTEGGIILPSVPTNPPAN